LRDQIIGTWNIVVAEVAAPDGKKSLPFGETPKGVLIFTADGHFAQIHVASDVPKIASGNRLTGTPEQYTAIMRRSISVFGDYSVNEEKKMVTFKIVSATYPNWQGEAQERSIDKLTADEFVNTTITLPAGTAVRPITTSERTRRRLTFALGQARIGRCLARQWQP
jgi:hypothetical protein